MVDIGLDQFIDQGIEKILQAVERAVPVSLLAGLRPKEAADRATERARNDLRVQDEVESNRLLRHDFLVTAAIEPQGDVDLYGFMLDRAAPVILSLAKPRVSTSSICFAVFPRGSLEQVKGGERQCVVSAQVPARMGLSLPEGSYSVLVDGDGVGDYALLYLLADN
jgi:hypothetical protein